MVCPGCIAFSKGISNRGSQRVLSESLIVGYYHNEPHEVCALGVKQQEPLWATARSNGKKPALTFRKDSKVKGGAFEI